MLAPIVAFGVHADKAHAKDSGMHSDHDSAITNDVRATNEAQVIS